MKFILLKFIFAIFFTLVYTAKALVEEPNYDFTFDKFETFLPGQTLEQVKLKYPSVKLINKSGSTETYEVDIIHVRYKFPLYFQIKDSKIVDYYAKLPSYFLHDTFHQSLINRFGKQNKYYNLNNHSYYIWNNAKGLTVTYNGACTITCFPVFIHAISSTDKALLKESLIEKFKKNQL